MFRKGDRVLHDRYGEGTVRTVETSGLFKDSFGVEFDTYSDSLHSLQGMVRDGYGWYCIPGRLSLIERNYDWD